jgi:hypothetical protein
VAHWPCQPHFSLKAKLLGESWVLAGGFKNGKLLEKETWFQKKIAGEKNTVLGFFKHSQNLNIVQLK